MCIRYLSAYRGQWSQYRQQNPQSDTAERSTAVLLSYPRSHLQSIQDIQVQLVQSL